MQLFGEAVLFRDLPLHPRRGRLLLLLFGVDAFRFVLLPLRIKIRIAELLLLIRLDAVWQHLLPLRVKHGDKVRDVELLVFVRLDAVGQ